MGSTSPLLCPHENVAQWVKRMVEAGLKRYSLPLTVSVTILTPGELVIDFDTKTTKAIAKIMNMEIAEFMYGSFFHLCHDHVLSLGGRVLSITQVFTDQRKLDNWKIEYELP